MAQYFELHSDNPQPRLIRQAADLVRLGAVVVYPTDSCYALGCHLDDKSALQRIRRIRSLDDDHLMTLMCRDLSEISRYAKVSNAAYRLLRAHTPGPYTFLLEATKEVPKRLQHPKRATIGLRIPAHPVPLALMEVLGEPMVSSSLLLPDTEEVLSEGEEIRVRLEKEVDVILISERIGHGLTTVVDLSAEIPVLVRAGLGPTNALGLED